MNTDRIYGVFCVVLLAVLLGMGIAFFACDDDDDEFENDDDDDDETDDDSASKDDCVSLLNHYLSCDFAYDYYYDTCFVAWCKGGNYDEIGQMALPQYDFDPTCFSSSCDEIYDCRGVMNKFGGGSCLYD